VAGKPAIQVEKEGTEFVSNFIDVLAEAAKNHQYSWSVIDGFNTN
jgi:hypothetical protein